MSPEDDRYVCGQCSEIHERVCARIAADRIAKLTAELAEVRLYYAGWEGRMDDLARERDEERTAHERTKAELNDCKADATLHEQLHDAVAAKLTEALAREQAAQSEAAAMRDTITHALDTLHSPRVRPSGHEGCEETGEHYEDCAKCAVEASISRGEAALNGTAGRALAARVPLLEATLAAFARSGLHACWKCGLIMKSVSKALREKCSECGAALAALDEKVTP